ncbi:Nucleotide-binding universal stress protein, UspA family [Granulicatella balaenopterae]|uniref:Universal stress protein n=1 Tax=Granulicatella balaenopterae TaxID=137733 RepID=A0A1H9MRR2_9LACT|nr:universal stress protein [Granulicatella balaenopterae]SER26291.1 Nucleotide-binding universal stress protein, UspA family [Granulicatella balaenopterae]
MFHEYTRILVPVDGSQEAKLAYDKAIEVAKRNNATLVLAHVIDTRSLQTPAGFEGNFTEEIRSQAENLFGEYIEQAKESDFEAIETVIEYGSPKHIISKNLPVDHNIDLIMIGATGLNAVERLFIGSVSEFVIRNARCDVMVIRTDLENELPQ